MTPSQPLSPRGRGVFHATMWAMLVALRIPHGNPRGPLYFEQALRALFDAGVALELLIVTLDGQATLLCRFAAADRNLVHAQLTAAYPELRIDPLDDDALPRCRAGTVHSLYLALEPELIPLRTAGGFADPIERTLADPLASLLAAIGAGASKHRRGIRLTVRPLSRRRRRRASRAARRFDAPIFRAYKKLGRWWLRQRIHGYLTGRAIACILGRLLAPPGRLQEGVASKLAEPLFSATLELSVWGDDREAALRDLRELASPFAAFSTGSVAFRVWAKARPFILSPGEVASLWHPPTVTVDIPNLAEVRSRLLSPPVNLPTVDREADLAVLGTTKLQRLQPFGLRFEDRFRHLLILGKSGMGKTTVLQQLILSDIERGHGLTLIDPHGDLADAVLAAVPTRRTNDVIAFDAGDHDSVIAFNPLACNHPDDRPLVASGVVSAFKKMFSHSWGPRLEYWLRNAVLAMVEIPDATLITLVRFLNDAGYRAKLLDRVADPIVCDAWLREFAAMPAKLQVESLAPILNKVGTYVSSPQLRAIVGQSQARLDLGDVLDQKKVFIANLSKGRLGEDASNLLGALLVTSLQVAVMRRARIPESQRQPHFLYIDEFQNIATDSFTTILSEARKYRLGFIGANQFLAQLDENTRSAVFGNVGSLVVFGVGVEDAEILAKQLGERITPQDLLTCPKYYAFVRMLIDGHPTPPFSMRTIPPRKRSLDPRRAEIVRRVTARLYGADASKVVRAHVDVAFQK